MSRSATQPWTRVGSVTAAALLAGCFVDAPMPSDEQPDEEGSSSAPLTGTADADTPGDPTTLGWGETSGGELDESGDGPDDGTSSDGPDGDDDRDADDGTPGCRSDSDCGDDEYCDGQCQPIACGDAIVHGQEQCDDGNAVDGDGCDDDCTYTEVVIDVSWHNTCALIEGGRVRCWGDGAQGQLGYGNPQSVGDDELPWHAGDVGLPHAMQQLHSGDAFACALNDDDVYCWGDASDGAIGSGTLDNLGDDELLAALSPIVLGEPTTKLSVGGRHSCASGPSGQLRCWGSGAALGYGTSDVVGDDETPASAGTVSIGAAIIDVSAGIRATCVVQTDGAVRCWGDNEQGQLGLGHTQAIGDDELPSSIAALEFEQDAIEVAAGYRHTCARFVGGGVRCWGGNAYGESGRGDTEQQGDDELVIDLPTIALGDLGSVTHIAAGDHHTCALSEDGEVKCWGRNSFGQLGTGTFEHVGDDELPASVPVVGLPGPVRQLDAGGNHTCAVLTDYRVYCWGRNADGQLGLGHEQDVAVPLVVGAIPVLDPAQPR